MSGVFAGSIRTNSRPALLKVPAGRLRHGAGVRYRSVLQNAPRKLRTADVISAEPASIRQRGKKCVSRENRVAVVVTRAGGEVVFFARETADQIAGSDGGIIGHPEVGVAVKQVDLAALESVPDLEVHHTSHRIRAISRRGAILQDFDALDESKRQRIDVLETEGAPAIDHRERVPAPERAQIDLRGACPARAIVFVLGVADERGHVPQPFGRSVRATSVNCSSV